MFLTINLISGTSEVPNPDSPDELIEVPAIYVSSIPLPIWVAPADTWWDKWGDSRPSALEVCADHLSDLLL